MANSGFSVLRFLGSLFCLAASLFFSFPIFLVTVFASGLASLCIIAPILYFAGVAAEDVPVEFFLACFVIIGLIAWAIAACAAYWELRTQ